MSEVLLNMNKGDTLVMDLTVTDQDGDPVNLTSAVMIMSAKTGYGASSNIFSISSTGGEITYPNPALGQAEIVLPSSSTSGLSITTQTAYVYDVRVTLSNGQTFTLLYGKLNVFPSVAGVPA